MGERSNARSSDAPKEALKVVLMESKQNNRMRSKMQVKETPASDPTAWNRCRSLYASAHALLVRLHGLSGLVSGTVNAVKKVEPGRLACSRRCKFTRE